MKMFWKLLSIDDPTFRGYNLQRIKLEKSKCIVIQHRSAEIYFIKFINKLERKNESSEEEEWKFLVIVRKFKQRSHILHSRTTISTKV